MNELHAHHLRKAFKTRLVVDDISIHIKAGECVGLLGPNGAGKTTCFYMIVGLQRPDEGDILLNEHNITKKTMDERAN